MPSVTLGVEADVSVRVDTSIAAGAGPHLPIGYWSGATYRSAMRFDAPSWGGWTKITKATLSFYISDHAHVGVRNSTLYARRMSILDDVWTKSAGTQSCSDGFAGGNNTQHDDIVPVSADQVAWQCGTTPNAEKSVTVTSLVRSYWNADKPKIVFIFSPESGNDYTELWADEKSGFNAELVIEYEDEGPPDAPDLIEPLGGEGLDTATPTFDWSHIDQQGDPQVSAEVRILTIGESLLYLWPVSGATSMLVAPTPLAVGSYKWDVRTADASGWGPRSSKRIFSIESVPTATIDGTRRMEFANGAPRLRVNWSCTATQQRYRVMSGGFDSGWLTGTTQSYVMTTVPLTDNLPVLVTVMVETPEGHQITSPSASFTPRYGLSTHRKDLGSSPVNWEQPTVLATVPPNAQLVLEYGSNTSAAASPSAWYPALSGVPKARYLYWRVWFIPSATSGPSLDKLTIPANFTVPAVDKWGTTRDAPGLTAPWSIDTGEAVYGTRSMTADVGAAGPYRAYSYGMKVRAGRSYILTGLMKSENNSGAQFQLQDEYGTVLVDDLGRPIQSDMLQETIDWFTTDRNDVNRYRTPVWVAPSDMTVYVVLRVGGGGASAARLAGSLAVTNNAVGVLTPGTTNLDGIVASHAVFSATLTGGGSPGEAVLAGLVPAEGAVAGNLSLGAAGAALAANMAAAGALVGSLTPFVTCPPNLQTAVNALASGGTLDITGCTYTQAVTLNKPMTLRGGIIDGQNSRQTGITIAANGVTVDGTEIKNHTGYWQTGGGINGYNIHNFVARNVYAHHNGGYGIALHGGTNWLIDGGEYAFNSQGGYTLTGVWGGTTLTGCVVDGVSFHDNNNTGAPACVPGQSTDGEHCMTAGEWDGTWAGRWRPTWEGGGGKVVQTGSATGTGTPGAGIIFKNCYVYNNGGPGIWFDIDVNDVIIENNVVYDNRLSGIFYEISDNAIIRGNISWHNGHDDPRYIVDGWEGFSADMLISSSRQVEIYDNLLGRDSLIGLSILSQNRGGRWDIVWDINVHDNRILGGTVPELGLGQFWRVHWYDDYAGSPYITSFADNVGANNKYEGPDGTRYVWNGNKNLAAYNATQAEEGGAYLTAGELADALAELVGEP